MGQSWTISGKAEGAFARMFTRPYGYWRTACWRCDSGSLIGSLVAIDTRRC
jgi:hypothetical protein